MKPKSTPALLRDAAQVAYMASHWQERFEKGRSPEHRINALRALREAREKLTHAESLMTDAQQKGAA